MTSIDTLRTVDEEFPGWYAEFQISEDLGRQKARLSGLTELSKISDSEDVEALIRIALQTKQPANPIKLTKILDVFKEKGENYPVISGRELQVVAAATLVKKMELQLAPSITALAISNAICGGARQAKLPMDLAARVEKTLQNRAEINRQRPDLNAEYKNLDSLQFSLSVAQQKITNQTDFNGVIAAFGELQTALKEIFDDRAKDEIKMFKKIVDHLSMKDEELDMLWWLTGQRSTDMVCNFSELSTEMQPFVLAKELAELTVFLPGPTSVTGLLSRAGVKENRKKIKLVAAINGVSSEWVSAIVDEGDYSPITMPLHFAFKKKIENGVGEEWIQYWANVTGIQSTFQITPIDLAVIFYRERIFDKFQ